MVLARVHLAKNPADPRTIVSQDYEQIFDDKPVSGELIDYLNVRKALLVCANFISALNDENPFRFQNSFHLVRSAEIQIQNCFVVLLLRAVRCNVIRIIVFVILVIHVSGPPGVCIYGGSKTTQSKLLFS